MKIKSYLKFGTVICMFLALILCVTICPKQVYAKAIEVSVTSEEYTVAFDPDDGKTAFENFYKVTVPKGSLISKPADPKRDGYLFNGWYHSLDANGKPVFWRFTSDTVQNNTTLWADWTEGCLVVYDPDDGVTDYNNFYKTTVRIGGKVTDKPPNPTREGYIFKGWYAYLGENGNPVLWDFENNIVENNTTLWACWEVGTTNPGNNNNNNNDTNTQIKGKSLNTPTRNNHITIEDREPPLAEIEDNEVPQTGASNVLVPPTVAALTVLTFGLFFSIRKKSK